MLRSQALFYTLAGALGGGAIGLLAATFASVWYVYGATTTLDIIAAVLLLIVAVLIASIAEKQERLEKKITLRADRRRRELDRRILLQQIRLQNMITRDFTSDDSSESEDPEIDADIDDRVDQIRDELIELRNNGEEEGKKYQRTVFGISVIAIVLAIAFVVMGHGPHTSNPTIPSIQFSCEPCTLDSGESSRLSWDVSYATEITLNGESVDSHAIRYVRPSDATEYFYLRATNSSGYTISVIKVNTVFPSSILSDTLENPSR